MENRFIINIFLVCFVLFLVSTFVIGYDSGLAPNILGHSLGEIGVTKQSSFIFVNYDKLEKNSGCMNALNLDQLNDHKCWNEDSSFLSNLDRCECGIGVKTWGPNDVVTYDPCTENTRISPDMIWYPVGKIEDIKLSEKTIIPINNVRTGFIIPASFYNNLPQYIYTPTGCSCNSNNGNCAFSYDTYQKQNLGSVLTSV